MALIQLLLLLASLSPAERKLRASIAGLTGWANTDDRRARAAHASRGNWQKFYNATDPSLPEDVRAGQADSAYKAHMKRLTFLSMKASRERREQAVRDAQARKAARQAEPLGGLDASWDEDAARKAARAARRKLARDRRKAAARQAELDGGAA
jgi:hypothetical protein